MLIVATIVMIMSALSFEDFIAKLNEQIKIQVWICLLHFFLSKLRSLWRSSRWSIARATVVPLSELHCKLGKKIAKTSSFISVSSLQKHVFMQKNNEFKKDDKF